MLLDEVVNKISRFFILKLALTDTGSRKELLQFWVDVLKIESTVWIPANVTDVLEVRGQADVLFLQLHFLFTFLLHAEVKMSWLM